MIIGSDGMEYPFLQKEEKKGDLKKDKRMMEFGLLVNNILRKNVEQRNRKLSIRTY